MRWRIMRRVGVWSLLAAGCSDGGLRLVDITRQLLPACTSKSATPVVLNAAGNYQAVDPGAVAGCVSITANTSGPDREYLLVPEIVSGHPGDTSNFALQGAVFAPAPPVGQVAAAEPSLPEQFHLMLRQRERELAASAPRPPAVFRAPPVAAGPPLPGDVRTFSKVCASIDCKQTASVTATAKTVGLHVAIYLDNAAPANQLTQVELDALRDQFDTRLYPTDTSAFGRESDIDNNGVVIVLMTNQVNQLVTATQCASTGFIVGYFYGGDLLTGVGNNGEIFYSLVVDSAGTLSCPHSRNGLKRILPSTFAHEFQHMISFAAHLARGGLPEQLWLNEGLSHYAEQHAGRTFLPTDDSSFCDFARGDLYDAGQYFSAPGNHFLLARAGIGTLAERGAMWLFVQYLVDQTASDTSQAAADAVTRRLVQTSDSGASNVEAVTGVPFATTVTRWALANYVSDLPGFATPPELQYKWWHFRADFPAWSATCPKPNSIPTAYPLVPPVGSGATVNLAGLLRAGSGFYYRAQQPAGTAAFTLRFSDGAGGPIGAKFVPRLDVLRIQ